MISVVRCYTTDVIKVKQKSHNFHTSKLSKFTGMITVGSVGLVLGFLTCYICKKSNNTLNSGLKPVLVHKDVSAIDDKQYSQQETQTEMQDLFNTSLQEYKIDLNKSFSDKNPIFIDTASHSNGLENTPLSSAEKQKPVFSVTNLEESFGVSTMKNTIVEDKKLYIPKFPDQKTDKSYRTVRSNSYKIVSPKDVSKLSKADNSLSNIKPKKNIKLWK